MRAKRNIRLPTWFTQKIMANNSWILLRRYEGKGIKRIKSSYCPSGLGVHGLHWYIYQSTLVIGALVGTVTYIG